MVLADSPIHEYSREYIYFIFYGNGSGRPQLYLVFIPISYGGVVFYAAGKKALIGS
jgi:hypothetical protein